MRAALAVFLGMRWTLLPFSLLHELLHVAAARPWVEQWRVEFGSHDRPCAQVQFRDDAPLWGIALAHLAPLLASGVIMLATGVALITGLFPALPPRLNLLLWTMLLASIVLLSKPSQADKDIEDAVAAVQGGEADA